MEARRGNRRLAVTSSPHLDDLQSFPVFQSWIVLDRSSYADLSGRMLQRGAREIVNDKFGTNDRDVGGLLDKVGSEMAKVLMVLTGSKVWTMKNGFPHPTGFWAEEFIRPHSAFSAAGLGVAIATPHGVAPTPDPLSLSSQYYSDEEISEQQAYLDKLAEEFASPLKLEDISAADWDVVFQVGGHGPMQDLAVHPTVGQLFADVLTDKSKILAAVCHGPAAFLSAHLPDGTWLMKGRRLTAFSNEEENQATFAANAPWLLEDRLRLAGALYEAAPPWTPNVVVDGNLITGQQQKSAGAAANEVLKKLDLPTSS